MTGPQFDHNFSCSRGRPSGIVLHHTWRMKPAPSFWFTSQLETYERKISFLPPTQHRPGGLLPGEGKPDWKESLLSWVTSSATPSISTEEIFMYQSREDTAAEATLLRNTTGCLQPPLVPSQLGGLPPAYAWKERTAGPEQAAHDRRTGELINPARGSPLTRATVITTAAGHPPPGQRRRHEGASPPRAPASSRPALRRAAPPSPAGHWLPLSPSQPGEEALGLLQAVAAVGSFSRLPPSRGCLGSAGG